MSLFLDSTSGDFDLASVMGKVLLPVVIGILLHSKGVSFAEKNRSRLKLFDQSIILLIIYNSFSQSFYHHVFDDLRLVELLLLGVGMMALFLIVFRLLNFISRLLKFKKEDRITVLFCGSKKSLVHGTVMSKVLFTPNATTGMIFLPLMLYHSLQLVMASMMASMIAKRMASAEEK